MVYPRITLCNLNPASGSQALMSLNGKHTSDIFKEYMTSLNKNTNCNGNCSAKEQATLDIIHKELSGILGVNQFTGVNFAKKLGHQKDTFITSCSLGHKKGVADVYLPCNGTVNITTIFSPIMSNCFSTNTPMYSDYENANGISLILFLDNLIENQTFLFDEQHDMSAVGAYLELSSKSEMPLVTDQWTTFSPGGVDGGVLVMGGSRWVVE